MTGGSHRLPTGGRIDRMRSIRFSLEGRTLAGFAGDTLASSLLANGVTIVARSFKYHRPRGFVGAGIEEPNGLFTLGSGGRTTPNVAGTITELHEGLIAARQNGWPSVDFDLLAVNSWAAPLLGAGFYYKTFMGPFRGSWMFYEKYIRRAAGLGRAVHERDPDRYETRHLHADVLVIGSGPAGLAAALSAGQSGARVVIVEQDSLPGGSLLSAPADGAEERWRVSMLESLKGLSTVEILDRTTALGLYEGNTVAMVERFRGDAEGYRPADPERGEARETAITVRAAAIVFATGAIERPLVFSDNDRPGVMLASAAQTYVNRFAVAPGRRVVVATNNDSAWYAASELAAAGMSVTLLEQRVSVAARVRSSAERAGVSVRTDALLTRALGRRSVTGVGFVSGSAAGESSFDCDLLCVSGGWSPLLHLTSHNGSKPRYRADIDSFVPGGMAAGHFAAGAVAGEFSPAAAIQRGREAGLEAARHAGFESARGDMPQGELADAVYGVEPARAAPSGRGKAFVDFQNDVTTNDLEIAHQEGFESVEPSLRSPRIFNGYRRIYNGVEKAYVFNRRDLKGATFVGFEVNASHCLNKL